jgi:hypothetical protein
MARVRIVERQFPKLRTVVYSRTSPSTIRYNCVAWVFGDRRRWWEIGYYWPSKTEIGDTAGSIVRFFESFGFEDSNPKPEPGFEKIAIYADRDNYFTHVACQKSDGTWSSKLGDGHDIDHATAECLTGREGNEYGSIIGYMKWRIPKTKQTYGQTPKR